MNLRISVYAILLVFFGLQLNASPVSEAEELMKLQKFPEAEVKLDAAAIKDSDYARYLRATARFRNKKFKQSISDCDSINKESEWYHKAIFLKANNLIEQTQHGELETIYRSQAERLLAEQRKDDLAKLLIDFASELSEIPETSDVIPKSKAEDAITLLTKAGEIDTSPVLSEQILFQTIQVLRDHESASNNRILQACGNYLEKFDPDWKGLESVPKSSEEAELAGKNLWQTRVILIETYADTRNDQRELRRYVKSIQDQAPNPGDIAWIVANSKQNSYIPAIPNQSAGFQWQGLAQGQGRVDSSAEPKPLREFLKNYPNHGRSAEAAITLARIQKGDDAIQAYENFLDRKNWTQPTLDRGNKLDPATVLNQWQEQATFQIAQIHFDQKDYQSAIKQWQAYSKQFANGTLWKKAQSQLVTAEYAAALEPVANEDEAEARKRIEAFAANHPLDSRLPSLLYLLGEFPYVEATALKEDKQPAEKHEPLYEKAIAEWANLLAKYPNSNEAAQANYRTALINADIFGDIDKAIEGFKKVKGSYQSLAKQQIDLLNDESLALTTERVYRNNETAKVNLSVRNIESISVSQYNLDLEKFFRSHHRFDTSNGIEALDIELIQPDKTWEVKLDNYTKHKLIEQEIDIAFEDKKPGVAIIRIEAKGWQASTIVMRSNIDLITQATWREGLVFASDSTTQKPLVDANVLVSNGKEIIGQGETDANGLFRLKGQMIRDAANLHFYVRSDQGEAIKRLNIVGMTQEITGGYRSDKYATLDARGYLYTNKSTYHYGDTVHARGVFRDVKDGNYIAKSGDKVLVELLAPNASSARKWEVELNDFGSFSIEFDLPKKGNGTYVLQAKLKKAPETVSYSTRISLQKKSDQTEAVSITFDTQSVLQGQAINGTVLLNTPWGNPIPNQPFKLAYPDGRSETLTTDKFGRAKFTQETTELSSGTYQRFRATVNHSAISHRSCSETGSIYIQPAKFDINWEQWPSVALAGKPLSMSVKATDENGDPVKQKLTFEFKNLPKPPKFKVLGSLSNISYIPAPKQTPSTLKKDVTANVNDDGEAVLAIKAPDAGRYMVSVSGKDSEGNEVRILRQIIIAGEKDDSKVHIFAAKKTVKTGPPLKLNIHSQVKTPLALMTLAGVDVIENQVLTLKKGDNEIQLPITDAHWPRFEVTVAYIEDEKLQRVRQEFVVERKLDIEVKLPDNIVPGEEIEVEIATKNASGEPIAAEVYLNLSGNLVDHQYGFTKHLEENKRPGSSFRFSSTAQFVHSATTRFLSPDSDSESLPKEKQNHKQALANIRNGESRKRRTPSSGYISQKIKYGARNTSNSSLNNTSDAYFWSGPIITTDQGTATVKLPIPEDLGKWKLSAVGCDSGHLYGETDQEIETKNGILITQISPTGLRVGDSWIPELKVAINDDKKRTVKLTSKAGENSQEKSITISPGEPQSVYFNAISFTDTNPIVWQTSADGQQRKNQTISILSKELMRPNFSSEPLAKAQTIEAFLDDAIASLDRQTDASALLSAVSALRFYRQQNLDRPQLESLIRQLILSLQVTQKDGGWPWQGVRWTRDSWTTTIGLWGLREAKELGFEVNQIMIDQGVDYLQKILAIVPPDEPEKSAMILFALALEDAENFSIANRLYRQRNNLDATTLAFLAGTFNRMEREKEVDEILKNLLDRSKEDFVTGSTKIARLSQPGDITAVALHSLAQRKSKQSQRFANWLLNNDLTRYSSASPAQGIWTAALTEHFLNDPNQTLQQFPATQVIETRDPSNLLPTIIKRTYTSASTLPYEDKHLKSRSTSTVKNAELGQLLRVQIEVKKPKKPYLSYLQIDESIPAGCMVKPASLKAKHAKVEFTDGGIRILTLPNWDSQIEYELIALRPGSFHVPATVIRDNCRPERFQTGQSYDLTILNADLKSPELYQINVDERLELARLDFENKNFDSALKHLNALTTEHKDDKKVATNEREISRMLLWILASQTNTDPKLLVERFEALSERHSDVVIPFDKILKVAEAYKSIGELERAWLVYRAVVESNFVNDAKVANTLKQLGDFLGYADMQNSLWYQYPDETDVLIAYQSFAQDLEEQANELDSLKLRKGQTKPEREELLKQSLDHSNRFLTLYPDNKEADVNAFRLASLHFDLKDYAKVASVAESAVQMFPKSRFYSSFQYMAALGHFWQYEFPRSLASAKPVAQGQTENALNAKYIIAQVYHAQGNPAKAIEWYEKVKSEFADARQSLDYITEKAIRLPDATTFNPGEKVTVELSYRNIKEADIQVYKVDLMRLYSRQKDLTNISKVSLAGISPETELAVKLGKGDAYKWQTRELELPITEVGAYLLVCRGDSTFSSSLVLVSPLELEVRESVGEGDIRFHLWDPKKKAYVADAEIKVFDNAGSKVHQGRTDPRGVFQASGINGFATVVVKHKDVNYAYYRSSQPLTRRAVVIKQVLAPQTRTRIAVPITKPKPTSEKDRYFRALKSELKQNSSQQKAEFNKLLKRTKGVEASKAYRK